ncbi:hypothetical protein WMY93_003148 [Mugilogobius chulae]|uniref:Cytoskeleton-associated protein 2 C-terminal domain-containing protein n=1 Tax=Mugilogobius chulae TaxID=88201 RepID=A0AAW0Q6I0_9GOBI
MASFITIEETLRSWKGEQAQIHHSLQLCTEILDALTSQPRSSVGLKSEVHTDTSTVEKEEMDLLEQALEKALQVRSGLEPVTRSSTIKTPTTQNERGAARKISAKRSKVLPKNKLICKTIEQKDQRKYQTTIYCPSTKTSDGKCVQMKDPKNKNLTSLTHVHNSEKLLQDQHGQQQLLCGSEKTIMKMSGKNTKAVTYPSTSNPASFSNSSESGNLLFQRNVLKWTLLKRKENRLWDKILTLEKKPVYERDQFLTRMRETFPRRWPCGSPEKIQVLVHRLSQQGQDLTDDRQTDDLMTSQSPQVETKQGYNQQNDCMAISTFKYSIFCIMCYFLGEFKFQRHKMTPQKTRKCAVQVKRGNIHYICLTLTFFSSSQRKPN